MNKLFKIGKSILLGLLGLIVVIAVGLLFYYQSLFKETPLPTQIAAKPSLAKNIAASDKPVLLPIPKKLVWTSGAFKLPNPLTFSASASEVERIKKICKNRLNTEGVATASGAVKFLFLKEINPQSYRLTIQPNLMTVEYGDVEGLFYAMTTVKQLANQTNNQLPCVQIEDAPDMKTRGAMLDISRGKIPTLETLYGIVDFLSDVKYNQLQLYIESFPFAYPSFKNLWEKTETPLTPEEIKQLDAYCKDRFIELVPNQNSLGHMQAWLKTDEYKDLAECPEGYKLLGLIDMKTTMSPTNPKTLALVKKMSEDLLPNFTSNKFNVNLDEPFELGKSKTRPISDPKEVAKLYINYAKQLNEYVNSKGKTMMMWGDVVTKTPEIIPEIPKNITLLEWGYENIHPFEKNCAMYQKGGLHYMVCPGTSSWSSFTGRTDNMMGNVENAITNGIKYGADGMLMTDWGDTPHLQYWTVSYAGLAYAAALSWHNESKNQVALGGYLSKNAFNDKSNKMGDLVLEMGRYDQFEEYPTVSMTTTGMAYRFGIMDKMMLDAIDKKLKTGIFDLLPPDETLKKHFSNRFNNPKIYNTKAIVAFVDSLEKQLSQVHLNRPDSTLIVDEYKNGLRMVALGAKLKQFNNYHLQQTDADNKALLSEMKTLCSTILTEHKRLWLSRNKSGGYETSVEPLNKLEVQINDNLELLDKNAVSRWFNRSKEKIITAVGVLYLK